MQTTIYFYGGAGKVTGSNFLLDTGGAKFLIDCGLTQGHHSAEEDNWAAFPYNPSDIPFLIVTHAHIDHIGRIPKLVKDGFKGRIISTEATKALAEPLLLDSEELLHHEAEKHGKPVLYDEHDVARAMKLWEGVPYHKPLELVDGVTLELLDAGHILGSAMVRLSRGGKRIVFTGDLGGGNSPLLAPHDDPSPTDYLVMESVYGDRVRPEDKNRREELENVIEDAAARGGTLLIPAFSTERTQDLLYEIGMLMKEKRIPSMPVYMDSPLATKITAAYLAHPEYFAKDIEARVKGGEKIFAFPELHFVEDIEESHKVTSKPGPKIILAGSGMSSGGRVYGHEKVLLPDHTSTVLIVGYQAAGSLGRRLIEGEKEVRVMGQPVKVRANIEAIYGYSAHMDGEQLLEFVNKNQKGLQHVFVVMGEPSASSFLVQRIRDFLSVKATTPEAGEKAEIEL
jgi:metallo-beta-lactamase family protein